MKSLIFSLSFATFATTAGAAVLTTLPTPMNQGGMIHINVALQGGGLVVHLDPGTPVIQPLAAWKPGDTLDSASPWFSTLDPTQSAGLFNSQYGLVIDAGTTDPLPDGAKILVGWVSGTAGLEAFQWKNTAPQMFSGILGTDGSSTSWDWSTVSHGMMHPLFVMPAGSSGSATATLSFTLADASNVPLAGYTPAQTTLNFSVVPEPSAFVLSAGAGLLALRRRRTSAGS